MNNFTFKRVGRRKEKPLKFKVNKVTTNKCRRKRSYKDDYNDISRFSLPNSNLPMSILKHWSTSKGAQKKQHVIM